MRTCTSHPAAPRITACQPEARSGGLASRRACAGNRHRSRRPAAIDGTRAAARGGGSRAAADVAAAGYTCGTPAPLQPADVGQAILARRPPWMGTIQESHTRQGMWKQTPARHRARRPPMVQPLQPNARRTLRVPCRCHWAWLSWPPEPAPGRVRRDATVSQDRRRLRHCPLLAPGRPIWLRRTWQCCSAVVHGAAGRECSRRRLMPKGCRGKLAG